MNLPVDQRVCIACGVAKPSLAFPVQNKVDRPGAKPRRQTGSRCLDCERQRFEDRKLRVTSLRPPKPGTQKEPAMLKLVDRPKRAPSVDFEIATVTPEIARAWLDQNLSNRAVKARHVEAMARDMIAGDWKITGDAVRFDANNALLDGQHRLLACIKAGVPFTTAVIYGLPSEVKQSIDLGVSRSAADLLTMASVENANHVTAAARWLYMFRSGVVKRNTRVKVTVAEYMHILAKHKALPASVRECRRSHGIPISMVAAIHYIGTHLIGFPDRASAMADVMKTGAPDYQGDPIHTLRERMMRARSEAKYGMHREDLSAYFVHAWNNFAVRRPLGVVKAPNQVYIEGLDPKAL